MSEYSSDGSSVYFRTLAVTLFPRLCFLQSVSSSSEILVSLLSSELVSSSSSSELSSLLVGSSEHSFSLDFSVELLPGL